MIFLSFQLVFVSPLKAAMIKEIQPKNFELPSMTKQLKTTKQPLNGLIFTKTLKIGSRNEEVKKLQQVLGVELSDTFNSETEAMVKNFQSKNKLKSDGIVGLKTRFILNSLFSGSKKVVNQRILSQDIVLPNNLTVSLAEDNPSTGSLLSDGVNNVAGSQSLAHVLSLKLETLLSAEVVKIFSLRLRKIGNISDSDIENVYLYEQGGTRMVAKGKLSSGSVVFSGLESKPLLSISGSQIIWAMIDLNKDALFNQSLGFSINPALDIIGSTEGLGKSPKLISNDFLLSGNLMNIMTVSDLGRLIVTSKLIDNQLESTNNEVELLRLQLSAVNQNIKLQSLTIHQLGNLDNKDLINFKLYDGNTAVHQTLGVLDNNGGFTFDFYKFPLIIPSNSKKNLSIRAVLGDNSKNIKLIIKENTDIVATDASYNVNISS
ncbi:peptidoglycan-binding protein, partial [Candidatus Azambacteria bacterium]|nr:peptidoglycan-binding protein [Candidatus Azambacteria bacterium]